MLLVIPELLAPSLAFAFAIQQTQSRSGIRNQVPSCFNNLRQSHRITSRILLLALPRRRLRQRSIRHPCLRSPAFAGM